MARDFTIARPSQADADRIAEIHLAAMDTNPLLHAQFPTPESLAAAKAFLTSYTASQLDNATSGVLVARERESGTIVSFAKWDSPSHPEDVKLESGDLHEVQGCRREFMDTYVALAEQAKKRSFGDKACYRTYPHRCCLVPTNGICDCGSNGCTSPLSSFSTILNLRMLMCRSTRT